MGRTISRGEEVIARVCCRNAGRVGGVPPALGDDSTASVATADATTATGSASSDFSSTKASAAGTAPTAPATSAAFPDDTVEAPAAAAVTVRSALAGHSDLRLAQGTNR